MIHSPLFDAPKEVAARYTPDASATLFHGDAAELMATLPDGSVRLIITSPPYNLGKEYEDKVSVGDYLKQQSNLIAQFWRILADNGSICWQVGNFVEDGEVYPLDILYYDLFKRLSYRLRNRVIWYFGHGLHASKRFSGRYETLLWFTKSNNYIFNLDAVRVPSKYPGKRHYKGPNIGKPSGNPLGKNPSDVWEVLLKDWEALLWDIPNVKSNHPEKTIHPCQFPIELVERCVLALTNEGDLVFDPFAGVGSALIGALMHGRRAVGSERESEYVAIARERIASYFAGALRVRPLGKPVHQPSGREKVSQTPMEWRNTAANHH